MTKFPDIFAGPLKILIMSFSPWVWKYRDAQSMDLQRVHGAVEAAQAHDSLPEKARVGKASVLRSFILAMMHCRCHRICPNVSMLFHVYVGLGQCHSHPGRVKGGWTRNMMGPGGVLEPFREPNFGSRMRHFS